MLNKFLVLAMTLCMAMAMRMSFTVGAYSDKYCTHESIYVRLMDEQSVKTWTNSKYYPENEHRFVWNLDAEEL